MHNAESGEWTVKGDDFLDVKQHYLRRKFWFAGKCDRDIIINVINVISSWLKGNNEKYYNWRGNCALHSELSIRLSRRTNKRGFRSFIIISRCIATLVFPPPPPLPNSLLIPVGALISPFCLQLCKPLVKCKFSACDNTYDGNGSRTRGLESRAD